MSEISVIVPVYKVEEYINRCVDSILAQTFQNFKLILVDDGSPDSCGAICDEYATKDPRIHVIHQENGGLSAARNAGIDWVIENSDSDWLAFVDSDDWIHPEFLKAMYDAAQIMSVKLSCCDYQTLDHECKADYSHLELKPRLASPEELYVDQSGGKINAYAWRYLYHRDLFQDIRYPKGRLWEDLFTTHKLIFQCEKLAYVEKKMYFYFMREGSIVNSKWSEKRLDKIYGLEECLGYFSSRNMESVLQCAAREYLCSIECQYDDVHVSTLDQERREQVCQELRRKMQKGLQQYGKYQDTTMVNRMFLIIKMHPYGSKVYYLGQGIAANLKDRYNIIRDKLKSHKMI